MTNPASPKSIWVCLFRIRCPLTHPKPHFFWNGKQKNFSFRKKQLKIPLPREHFSRHHFWKIDKTHSLLTRIDLYVSCGPTNYIKRFLGPWGVFFICITCLENPQKVLYEPKMKPHALSKKSFFWHSKLDFGSSGVSLFENRQNSLSSHANLFVCVVWSQNLYQKIPWTLTRHFSKTSSKKALLEILAIFVFFHEFARFFENSKNKYVQELWALTFHCITVFKISNGVQRIAKFIFSGICRLTKIASPENTNFAILRTPLRFFNTVMSWKVRAHNSWTYFFFEFSKNLANSWKKTKMIRISLKF